ncbi:hypothetical protein LCGC14_2274220 [marine sediment metagenome]|uniref:Uncharacterized protein n=1 Tax=marine sediment metagenome TaxID=412755 RepID=A0A0F9FR57_9ZZZZ
MICLRCGYCCKHLWVIIVDNPHKNPSENNLIEHSGGGIACKHLRGTKPGDYKCNIHDKSWYDETPCFQHTQIEKHTNIECRMGRHILNKLSKGE